MSVMSSPRNRSRFGVDNPWDDDGFWRYRKFKARRRTGQPTGGRMWRRSLRANEKEIVRADIAQAIRDEQDSWDELMAEANDPYFDVYVEYTDPWFPAFYEPSEYLPEYFQDDEPEPLDDFFVGDRLDRDDWLY